MKTRNKVVLLALCMAAIIVVSVLGTMAYLTSTDTVVNTFTVGNVQIKLDEAKANADGSLVDGAARVQANSYKLIPGHTYNKDPMVTVLEGSEKAYIKMTVTFTKSAELDAIFASTNDTAYIENGHAKLTAMFNGYDSNNWTYVGNAEGTNNTRTYEFWYKEAVAAPDGNVALDALFDSITVPGFVTNAQLATINDMTITVNAYAIQADGFGTPADAWKAFN